MDSLGPGDAGSTAEPSHAEQGDDKRRIERWLAVTNAQLQERNSTSVAEQQEKVRRSVNLRGDDRCGECILVNREVCTKTEGAKAGRRSTACDACKQRRRRCQWAA